MPKEVQEIQDFSQGTVTTPSERDITPETAAYSLNIDPLTEDGKLIGVPQDRIVASLSENVPFEPLNYGLQWGATAIRIADLTKVPEASIDGEGSRIIFQGTRGVLEILKYTSSYFDTTQIKDTILNIDEGIGDASGEFTKDKTQFTIIDFTEKKAGLLNAGDVISLSSESDVANIPKSIEWMLVTEVNQDSNIVTVERGYYNTDAVDYTSLGTNTNIYRLKGLLGWLNVSGWQTNYKNNHIGQNPCIIYVSNAGATSADNLTHDSDNKTITITQNSLVNNLGANDAIEDLVRNNDIIKIINASGGVATVKVDYVTDGVINYSEINGSLSTQTSGSYWLDCNKIANGNFRAYNTSADGKTPYGWTTTINPSGTATYDDVYAADTNSIGSPQLSTTGGITGLKGNERDTSNSNYDSNEKPFLILSNCRDTSIADVTLTDALIKDVSNNRFRVSNPALFSEGDTLVLSHGQGIKLSNTSGNAYTGTNDNPYLQNYYIPGYAYEAFNVASFTDDDAVTVTIPVSIGGSGVGNILRLEDTSSDTLTSAGANNYVNISNEDAAGANASDAQLAENIVAAINGCGDAQRVTYGTATGIGNATDGIAGLSAAVNTSTNTKVDIWPTNGPPEEYVKIISIEVSQDAGGDAQPGFITVQRAYHGNLQAHTAGVSIKRILRTQIKQTVGASNFDSVQEGKKYKLTWWVSDVTKAWLGNNDYNLKPRLNFKVGCAGGYLLGDNTWSSDKNIVGANGEKAWLNSINYSTEIDSNEKTNLGGFSGSLYATFAGNKDIYNNTATGWVRGVISNDSQLNLDGLANMGSDIAIVQDSGTTFNGNWTLGDTTDENFVNSDSSFINVSPSALIHLSGALHTKSIFGIPVTNNIMNYYSVWDAARVTGETALNSNGSNPIRKFYIEFEDFVGHWTSLPNLTYPVQTPPYLSLTLSAADGHWATLFVPSGVSNGSLADGKTGGAGGPAWAGGGDPLEGAMGHYGQTLSSGTSLYDLDTDSGKINQANTNAYFWVATDGGNIGYYQTLPNQITSGGTWSGLANNDDNTGAVFNTGTAWAKGLKTAIEAAFNNWQGDGVTRFNVHQDGGKICIEDAIGGQVASNLRCLDTTSNEYTYFNGEGNFGSFMPHFTLKDGVMNAILCYRNIWNPGVKLWNEMSGDYQWGNSNEASGGVTHKGWIKGDGLGINLGAIGASGNYTSINQAEDDYVSQFTTCFHDGATPNAAEGAANLELAVEHANGHGGILSGAIANTDELTLTREDNISGGQALDLSRVPDRLEDNTEHSFSEGTTVGTLFEFYTGINNGATGNMKSLLWHKCEFNFILPDDKDISTLDVYFESDGEVWGTRNGGTIGSAVVDKYSSLIGVDSISLVENVEILPSIEAGTEITSSVSIKDSEDKELLLYHDKGNNTLNVLDDFGDPLDGHENTFRNTEGIPYEAPLNKPPSFTKNNREFHIGMGPNKDSLWAGFLNHKQFGNDLTNKFIIDKSEIESYDAQGAYTIDKICMPGFWLCTVGTGALYASSNEWTVKIPQSEHSFSVGDRVWVDVVSNKRTHEKSGTQATLDTDTYESTCMYMHPIYSSSRDNYTATGNGARIISISADEMKLDGSSTSRLTDDIASTDGDFALKIYPQYYYGIARDSFNLFRIKPTTGTISKATLSFKAQSICTSFSQSVGEVGETGTRFLGGRVWIAEKIGGQIHRINVARSDWNEIPKELSITPTWCTWWSSTEPNAGVDEVIVKDNPPTDRGHISDIIETWGLNGSTGSLNNDSDTRLWIQFYPNAGDSFGPLDNFIYCGNTDGLPLNPVVDVNFCNRTIPLNHTGGANQDEFDPHNRYGKTLAELRDENVSTIGSSNENISQRGRLISKMKLATINHGDFGGNFSRWTWFNPEFINHKWSPNATSDEQQAEEIHIKRANGEWEVDKASVTKTAKGFRNYAENIGWDSDAPEFKMIRYGLVALGDNDFDGVIDGTGLPVSSAANVNVGFENGKDCSSHAAAVLMQTDAKWILNGQVAGALPFHQKFQEWSKRSMGLHHSGVGYDGSSLNHTVELFTPDVFFMVTSDIWKMEKADCSSMHSDNINANSKGAFLIPTEDNNPKFSHASKSNTIGDGKLEHWSSSDWTDDDAHQFKDRVHLFRTAEKHNLSIGNNIVFAGPNANTRRGNTVFGQENFHLTTDYAHLCPVVGIVDEYHFLMNVTHGGNGEGDHKGNSSSSTFVDDSGSHEGVNEDFLNWKVGGSEYRGEANDSDGQQPRRDGGRVTLVNNKIEGGGMRFFSDGNIMGTYHSATSLAYNEDSDRMRPQGVNVFQTSLLSFCHARMIRPLGDMDVSGVANFNLDNSISLWMASVPHVVHGLVKYNIADTVTEEPTSYLCKNKLYMSQKADNGTLVYSFDWDNIMPDTNRATFEGVEYEGTTDNISSHRAFGTYELGDRDTAFRRKSTNMTFRNMHADNDSHLSAKGRFILEGSRNSQSSDTGHEGDAKDAANSQNFMIPGGFMIKAGSGKWSDGVDTVDHDNFKTTGREGLILGGSSQGLVRNSDVGNLYNEGGSLFSWGWDSHNSPWLRKGALNDFIAIWSYTAPMRDIKVSNSSNINDPGALEFIPGFNSDWAKGIGRSVARKVISSYATCGGYKDAVVAGTAEHQQMKTKCNGDIWIIPSGTTVNSDLTDAGYTGNDMLLPLSTSWQKWDPNLTEIFLRTHYPLPGTPGVGNNQSVTFIKSRDAALAPVRLDLELLPPYAGYTGAGDNAIVRVKGDPSNDEIHILGGPYTADSSGNDIDVIGALSGSIQTDGEDSQYYDAIGEQYNRVLISGTSSYNGEYILGGTTGTYVRKATTYTGSNSNEEIGRIKFLGSGKKTNPTLISGLEGLTLSGKIYSGSDIANNDSINQTTSFDSYDSIFAVSKSGEFKNGIIVKYMGYDYQNLYDSYAAGQDRYFEGNQGSYWVSSEEAISTTHSAYLTEGPHSYMFKAEVGFTIDPASSPGQGDANFTVNGDYKYKVSLVYDGYQEGPLSENSWPIDDIEDETQWYSAYDITLTVISPNKRLTSICLYRKNNENDLYRLVNEVSTSESAWQSSNDTHVITIRDDGGLEATFESRAGYSEHLINPFVKYGIGTSIAGYHFVANCSHPQIEDASHMIFRSLPGMFDLFNWANDFLTLPTKPTAMANFAGRLYAFDEINTYRINPETLIIEDTFMGSGCINQNSLIITDFGMFYCDRYNAYMHDGQSPQIISQSIKKGGGSDISSFNISDLSWEKTAGAKSSMDPIVSFDNRRNAVLFFVEKPGDELINHSRYYCWSYSILLSRWDLWEVSTGDNGAGVFDSSKVISPSSVITTLKGKNFITMGDYLVDYLGGTGTKPWQFLTKKLTVGHQSQKKVWKNIQLIGNDNDVTTSVGDPKGSISIAIDDTVIGGSDRVFTKDSPDGKVTIKGTSKTGRYLQFLLTEMTDSIDAMGIVFRRKGIK